MFIELSIGYNWTKGLEARWCLGKNCFVVHSAEKMRGKLKSWWLAQRFISVINVLRWQPVSWQTILRFSRPHLLVSPFYLFNIPNRLSPWTLETPNHFSSRKAKEGLTTSPDWLLGFLFGVGGFAGMYLDARCQKFVPQKFIKLMLGLIIVFLALTYIIQYF